MEAESCSPVRGEEVCVAFAAGQWMPTLCSAQWCLRWTHLHLESAHGWVCEGVGMGGEGKDTLH